MQEDLLNKIKNLNFVKKFYKLKTFLRWKKRASEERFKRNKKLLAETLEKDRSINYIMGKDVYSQMNDLINDLRLCSIVYIPEKKISLE